MAWQSVSFFDSGNPQSQAFFNGPMSSFSSCNSRVFLDSAPLAVKLVQPIEPVKDITMHSSGSRSTPDPRAAVIAIAWLGILITTPLLAQDTIGTCADLPSRLEACEPYECTFTHPFTGGEETRAVSPGEDGVCVYRESMPNNGEMTCRYDEATRKDIAAFYQESFDAESSGEAPPGNDALNEAMTDGTCQVFGY